MQSTSIQALKDSRREHWVLTEQLRADTAFQMRARLDNDLVDQYAANFNEILRNKPIDVVELETNQGKDWVIVDGFHRYAAAKVKKVDRVPIRLMKGTRHQAFQYAMAANWQHGQRPTREDAAHCIKKLLSTAPGFGYDAKSVVKWLYLQGIPESTARDHTQELRRSINDSRDAEIIRLRLNGETQREIAKAVGCSVGTVNRVIEDADVQKERPAETEHVEQPQQTPIPPKAIETDRIATALIRLADQLKGADAPRLLVQALGSDCDKTIEAVNVLRPFCQQIIDYQRPYISEVLKAG